MRSQSHRINIEKTSKEGRANCRRLVGNEFSLCEKCSNWRDYDAERSAPDEGN
jgi:hypothetical protein